MVESELKSESKKEEETDEDDEDKKFPGTNEKTRATLPL